MEDSYNITKAFVNDFNTFIATLNSNGMGDASVKAATIEGAAVAIPLSAVEEVSACFSNTLYGYFIGKRLAFPLVENYVKNSWVKFGLKRVMLDKGFFFQFETKEGMDKVMETGPWLIRLVPLILNVWTPNTILKKDEIKAALIWVKLHHVPIVAYSEIGLSLITTQIGRPIKLDSYTSQMCLRSKGRNKYARALIEVSSETDLMDSIVIAIPYSDGKGHTLATIDIEYEWRLPHCSTCKLFDHTNDACPKLPKVVERVQDNTDSFVEVWKKKKKPKQPIKQHTKSRQGDTSNASKKDHMNKPSSKPQGTGMELKNSFTSLDIDEDDLWDQGVSQNASLMDPNYMGGMADIVDNYSIHYLTEQVMHTRVWIKAERKELFCSFIYAHNRYVQHRCLWDSLSLHKCYIRGRPSCILGDFNDALNLEDSSVGSSFIDISIREFKECVKEIELMDVPRSGL
ncbi:retrovirus-related pol polyprotein from transposon 17.6 [Tanacetum coccineum]